MAMQKQEGNRKQEISRKCLGPPRNISGWTKLEKQIETNSTEEREENDFSQGG